VASESPLALFSYFLPRKLWKTICAESNRYHDQQVGARAEKIRAKQRAMKSQPQESKAEIRARLRAEKPFESYEYVRLMGLLIARMLCPHKQQITRHWTSVGEGAVPAGTFGRFIPLNSFHQLMKSLHFTNNEDSRAQIRSVVECLQATFRRGYSTPPVLSFDEGVLPSRSRYNPTRQYLKTKPHKWGTKLFTTCCASTSYCLSTRAKTRKRHTGAAAVIGNLTAVIPKVNDNWHLLHRHVYTAGTVMTNCVGVSKFIASTKTIKPKDRKRGDIIATVAKDYPLMTIVSCMDSKPVYFLGTCGSRATVQNYTTADGDTKRLRYGCKYSMLTAPTYVTLAVEMSNMIGNMLRGIHVTRSPRRTASKTVETGHCIRECPDMYAHPDCKRNRRQRACKVCSLLQRNDNTPGTRKKAKYFCDACSEEDKRHGPQSNVRGRIYLCNVLRHPQFGDNATCFQIWHKMWPCGTELPFVNKKIQMRGPGKKRSHRQVFGDDGVDD
ncbi:TPA: hypothetical protein N0F65_000633, partial [Lagenidium giganteum]